MDASKLRKIELFEPLSDAELKEVVPFLKPQSADRGETIVAMDQPGPTVFFLLDGEAKVSMVGSDGKEFLLTLFEEGDMFGELSAITGEDRSANVVALTDCHLVLMAAPDFLKLLNSTSSLTMSLLKILAQRLRQSSAKLGEMALLDVTDRVKQTLLSRAEKKVIDGKEVLFVEKRPTHQMLASMVGTSREMVTRALSLLEQTKELKFEGKSVYFSRT